MALYNSLADGEAESGTRICVLVQALKQAEDALCVLLFEADAVIAERDDPETLTRLG